MTDRNIITSYGDIVICVDGTMWKWIPNYTDSYLVSIPAHWEKIPPIPSDEEYQEQCCQIEKLYQDFYDTMNKSGSISSK